MSFASTLSPQDLIQFFMDDCNQRLQNELRQKINESTPPLSRVDRLHTAFRLRLEMVADYVRTGRWHEGMALGASSPEAAWETTEQLKSLVSVVVQEPITTCHDQQQEEPLSDLAKLSLGAVYVAAECHMLAADASSTDDHETTWEFLRTNLEYWETLQQQQGSIAPASLGDAAFLATTLATAFGNGFLSVSNLSPPSTDRLPTPQKLWQDTVNILRPTPPTREE